MDIQVNINLRQEDLIKLKTLARQADYDNRSAYVRLLIRQEWERQGNNGSTPSYQPVKEKAEEGA